MSLQLLRRSTRVLAPFMLALLFALALGSSGIASAHAATRLSTAQQEVPSQGNATTQRAANNLVTTLTVQGCGSQNCTGKVGASVHFTFSWSGGDGTSSIVFALGEGDGNTDRYICNNCTSGTYSFDHVYYVSGPHTAQVTVTYNDTGDTLPSSNAISMNIASVPGSNPSGTLVTLTLQGCASSSVCSAQPGVSEHFHLHWENAGGAFVGFTIHWGDNSYDTPRCVVNCVKGDADSQHSFGKGTFTVQADSNQTGESNIITMYVGVPLPSQNGNPNPNPNPNPNTSTNTACANTTTSPWGRASLNIMDLDGITIVGRVDERVSQDCKTWWARALAYPNGSFISRLWIKRNDTGAIVADLTGNSSNQGNQSLYTSPLPFSSYSPDQYSIVVIEQVGTHSVQQTLQPV